MCTWQKQTFAFYIKADFPSSNIFLSSVDGPRTLAGMIYDFKASLKWDCPMQLRMHRSITPYMRCWKKPYSWQFVLISVYKSGAQKEWSHVLIIICLFLCLSLMFQLPNLHGMNLCRLRLLDFPSKRCFLEGTLASISFVVSKVSCSNKLGKTKA